MPKPYKKHLTASTDLQTPYEATRAGFVALALEKNRRGTPFVNQARSLKATASAARTPMALLQMSEISAALVLAAGISDKAAKHLSDEDKRAAIKGLIEGYLEPAGDAFVEELVYRFLLTRGDSLGGSMRNVAGWLAQKRLNSSIVSNFENAGITFKWRPASGPKQWRESTGPEMYDVGIAGFSWTIKRLQRTLIYNLNVPISNTHVDICLFNCTPENYSPRILSSPASYLALGELKGGIDPAGADEHWKTARSALSRISASFAGAQASPHTFFIGGAIETKMATEIWEMLERGVIENAANLTSDVQLNSLVNWLIRV